MPNPDKALTDHKRYPLYLDGSYPDMTDEYKTAMEMIDADVDELETEVQKVANLKGEAPIKVTAAETSKTVSLDYGNGLSKNAAGALEVPVDGVTIGYGSSGLHVIGNGGGGGGEGGRAYTGVAPIVVDNSANTIAIAKKGITNEFLADGAVDSRVIKDGSITNDDIADGTISKDKLDDSLKNEIENGGGSISVSGLSIIDGYKAKNYAVTSEYEGFVAIEAGVAIGNKGLFKKATGVVDSTNKYANIGDCGLSLRDGSAYTCNKCVWESTKDESAPETYAITKISATGVTTTITTWQQSQTNYPRGMAYFSYDKVIVSRMNKSGTKPLLIMVLNKNGTFTNHSLPDPKGLMRIQEIICYDDNNILYSNYAYADLTNNTIKDTNTNDYLKVNSLCLKLNGKFYFFKDYPNPVHGTMPKIYMGLLPKLPTLNMDAVNLNRANITANEDGQFVIYGSYIRTTNLFGANYMSKTISYSCKDKIFYTISNAGLTVYTKE